MREPNSSLRQLGRFSEPGLLILVSLADGLKHGYAILEDIQQLAGIRLGPGTIYGALARLERMGLIAALPAVERRRPYRLTGGRRDSSSLRAHELAKPGRGRIAAAAGPCVKWLLALYPRGWRRRHGDEFVACWRSAVSRS
jgi:hypothetical protein